MSDYDQDSYTSLQFAADQQRSNPTVQGAWHKTSTGGVQFRQDQGAIAGDNYTSWGSNHHNGVVRSSSSGTETFGGISRVTAAEAVNRPSSGVMATALDGSGTPTTRLTESGTIEIDGLRVTADVAARMGYLKLNSDGTYSATSASLTSPDQFKTEEPPQDINQMTPEQQFSENLKAIQGEGGTLIGGYQGEAQIASMVEPVPQHVFDKAVALVNDAGSLDAVDWAEIGQASGLSPKDARTRAEIIDKMVTNSAENVLATEGISLKDQFFQEFITKNSKQAKAAALEFFQTRNPRAIRELAREFNKTGSLPPAEEFEASGYRTKFTPNGDLLVQVDGGWHSAKALARAGYIKRN